MFQNFQETLVNNNNDKYVYSSADLVDIEQANDGWTTTIGVAFHDFSQGMWPKFQLESDQLSCFL